ncbi:ATP-binding cassette domain-containing protein [Herbidospora sp. NEAU-GS84]|uniref:ATP-binding cassette domain-containing protein n=1 Tax=Herbidospora solisilvae TaxID=2696284 RepID=A0A7C9N8R2_9ACTN|nr:ABC transporter ATP-binding protein [Herbidospora solisilvae]NAS24253.1 ATP-binding cassette domain-containing protein [Herbidospora solisilvae]
MAESPTLGLLSRSVRARRGRLAASVVLALVSAAAGIVTPLLIARILGVIGGAGGDVVWPVAQLVVIVLAGAFAGGWSSYLLSAAGERAIEDVRLAVVRRAVRLRVPVIRRIGVGEVVSRMGPDAAQMRAITDTGVTVMPVSAVMVTAYLIVMGILDWVMLAVTVGTFVVAAIAIRAFLAGMRRAAEAQQAALGRLAQAAQSVFTMVTTVKAYRAEDRAIAPLEDEIGEAAASAVRSARAQAAISPLMGLGQQVAIIGVLAVGGVRLASGALETTAFIAFLMYLFQLVNPLMALAQGAGRIAVGKAAARRVDEVLGAETEPAGAARTPEVAPGAPALRLSDVEVSLGGKPVLDRVSLEVPRTGVLAIVGPSGAGKSTLLNVVEGFVETEAGRVELLGVPLQEWPTAEVRRRVALVEQGSAILSMSVRENLALGRSDSPSDDELWSALRDVGLEQAVRALPAGLDAVLGAGDQMSGGEEQRLSIARALLIDAEVLLLDEPTAHMDGVNERRLTDLLAALGRDRAVVMVTHRLSTVAAADTIVVVDAGRVTAVGDHGTLSSASPAYQAFVHAQAAPDPVGA